MYYSRSGRGQTIGLSEVCNMFNLTPRALRFYEERGLIATDRNEANWRSYDAEARRRLAWIADLRAVGVSIPDVHDVLEQDEADGARAAAALEKLAARSAQLRRTLEEIEALSQRLSTARPEAVAA